MKKPKINIGFNGFMGRNEQMESILRNTYRDGFYYCWNEVEKQEQEILADIRRRMKGLKAEIRLNKSERESHAFVLFYRSWLFSLAEIYKMIRTGKVDKKNEMRYLREKGTP